MIFLRARIETMSSISENLQCSQRICETVATPYSFDDYLAEKRGIKEGGGFRWQTQAPSPAFPLPHDLYNLNPFGYAAEESDFLKVHQSFSLYSVLLFFTSFSPLLLKKKNSGWSALLDFSLIFQVSTLSLSYFCFSRLKSWIFDSCHGTRPFPQCLKSVSATNALVTCELRLCTPRFTNQGDSCFIYCLFVRLFFLLSFVFFWLFFVLILFLKLRRLWKGFI